MNLLNELKINLEILYVSTTTLKWTLWRIRTVIGLEVKDIIYLGIDEEKYYLFKDATDEKTHVRFPIGETICIYDRESLSKWLLEDHSPTHAMLTEYEYQAL